MLVALIQDGKRQTQGIAEIHGSDLMGLIYTSGTTGQPKGVMLSHRNILFNCEGAQKAYDFRETDLSLSFLPWAHIFGQVGELHLLLSKGYSTAFAEGVAKIVENLAEIKPTVLISVPKIFCRIYEGVHTKMLLKPKPIQLLFHRGLEISEKKRQGLPLNPIDRMTHFLADALIFSKVRNGLGGRLRFAISGGAALDPDVGKFVQSLGIDIYEGYGLTETSPIIAANAPNACRIGTVGRAFPGVKIVIDTTVGSTENGEGEIIAYGEGVMQGYYNRPEETKAVLTSDGGLRTGDVGFMDSEGYLHISGRIKEQFKLLNGKYVAPAPLEEKIKLSPYVSNALVFGDNRPHNVLLMTVNIEEVRRFAASEGITASDADLLQHPRVRELYVQELQRHQKVFRSYEKPRNFQLIADDWTVENGLLTPTLKVKRRKVIELYASELDKLYTSA